MTSPLAAIPWARRLKLRHLEVLLVLHESGSLTAAATQLHMTQPALSHWLADVEEVIGQPLFVRGRRFVLTEAGEVLRSHAARMLGDAARTHADLQSVLSGASGRIHVGTGLPRVLLPMAIARLQQKRPGVFVSVVEAPLPELLERLGRREVDVIIGSLSAQVLAAGFSTEVLFADEIQVVAGSGHSLLSKPGFEWPEALQYPWILPPVGSVMRDGADKALAARGLTPPTACIEANSSVRVLLMTGKSNYLSILSASEVPLYRSLGVVDCLPLTPAISAPDVGAIWEAERCSALTQHFLGVLRAGAIEMSASA